MKRDDKTKYNVPVNGCYTLWAEGLFFPIFLHSHCSLELIRFLSAYHTEMKNKSDSVAYQFIWLFSYSFTVIWYQLSSTRLMLLQLLVSWYLWSAIYLMLSTHNSEKTTIDHIFMRRWVSGEMCHSTQKENDWLYRQLIEPNGCLLYNDWLCLELYFADLQIVLLDIEV